MRPGESFPHLAWRGMRVAPFPPPISRPGKEGLCRQGGATTLLPLLAEATYFASVVSGGGSFVQQELWCTCSKLRERRSAPTPPFLPPSWQQRKQTCCLSLSPAGFAGLSLSLLCLCCGPLVLPDVAGFSLHALSLPV